MSPKTEAFQFAASTEVSAPPALPTTAAPDGAASSTTVSAAPTAPLLFRFGQPSEAGNVSVSSRTRRLVNRAQHSAGREPTPAVPPPVSTLSTEGQVQVHQSKPHSFAFDLEKFTKHPTKDTRVIFRKPGSQPVVNKPTENKPVENKSTENKPVENKSTENKPVVNKSPENKLVDISTLDKDHSFTFSMKPAPQTTNQTDVVANEPQQRKESLPLSPNTKLPSGSRIRALFPSTSVMPIRPPRNTVTGFSFNPYPAPIKAPNRAPKPLQRDKCLRRVKRRDSYQPRVIIAATRHLPALRPVATVQDISAVATDKPFTFVKRPVSLAPPTSSSQPMISIATHDAVLSLAVPSIASLCQPMASLSISAAGEATTSISVNATNLEIRITNGTVKITINP